ncbi:MAG: choice-of-anchor D domain-containing protein [Spirochaetales bacterium]|nr:choice-of-anchor D domain-containing protein [Spirochaetales bacterium]
MKYISGKKITIIFIITALFLLSTCGLSINDTLSDELDDYYRDQIADEDNFSLQIAYQDYADGASYTFPAVFDEPTPDIAVLLVNNSDSRSITIDSVILNNTAEFYMTPSSVSTTVEAGSTYQFLIASDPDQVGTSTGTITVNYTIAGYGFTHAVSLSCTKSPVAIPDPAEIQITDPDNNLVSHNSSDFDMGYDDTDPVTAIFTIENIGEEDLHIYSITDDSSRYTIPDKPAANYALAGGSTVTFTVQLTDASSPADTVITVVTDAFNIPNFLINITGGGSGTTLDPPSIRITDPDSHVLSSGSFSYDFGYDAASAINRTFTITNTGDDDLHIYSVTTSNPEYTLTDAPPANTAIAGGGTDTFTLRLPDATVLTDTVITITSDAENIATFLLNVTGGGPDVQIDIAEDTGYLLDDLGYDFTYRSAYATADLTVENTGSAIMNIPEASLSLGGEDPGRFTITNVTSETVNPGSTTVITIGFTPDATPGDMFSNAVLTIEDNFGRTKDVYLEGSSCEQPDDFSGLALWLRADKIRMADVEEVSGDYRVNTLPDVAGNGNDAISVSTGSRPAFIDSSTGNRPSLHFNDSDILVVDPGSLDHIITGSLTNSGITTFIVFRPLVPNSNDYLICPTYSTTDTGYTFPRIRFNNYNWAGGTNWKRIEVYGYNITNYPELSTTANYNIQEADYALSLAINADTNIADLWMNSELNDLGTFALPAGAFTSTSANYASNTIRNRQLHFLMIGAYYDFDTFTSSAWYNGYISELFIYSSRLSDTDIDDLNTYMLEKYGISAF